MRPLLFSPCACVVLAVSPVLAASPDRTAAEIEALERRVRELEEQNHAILRELADLKASVGKRPAAAGRPAGRKGTEDEAPAWKRLAAGGSRFGLYGFLRVDAITDTSLPDDAQKPFFVRSREAPGGGGSNFTLHPRLSRLGLRFDGPPLKYAAGGKIGGQLEVDFQNRGSESRQVVRIRHAYLDLVWGDLSFLGGQTWDLVSPLYPTVNNDTLMWNAGNLGDRRPQLRLTYAPRVRGGALAVAGALGLTGAVGSEDLDEDGVRDGERSAMPNLQARVGYAHALWGQDPEQLAIGLWGHQTWEETDEAVGGESRFTSQAVGIDYALALSDRLGVRGEAWMGRNLDDFRGGIGQGVNPETGEEIRGAGGWVELGLEVNRLCSIFGGYAIDDPRNGDIPEAGRTRNAAWYVASRLRPGRPFLVGLDYLRWTTDFNGLKEGRDDRVNLYLQYDF